MIEPMLLKTCKESDLTKYEKDWIAQEKYDGTRIIVIKNGDNIELQTRSGKSNLASEYPEIVEELKSIHGNFILDGELIFRNNITGEIKFITGKAKDAKDGYTAILMLFDVLENADMNYRNYDQYVRTAWINDFVILHKFINITSVITHYNSFNDLYERKINDGREGIVLKKKTSIYQDGKRSKDWLKVKRVDTADCFIIGLMKGEGKYEDMFGSLILGQYDSDGKLIVVCNCSGFTDEDRKMFYTVIMASPYKEMFSSTKGELGHILHKCAPNMVVEIEFMERLESGSVRHPRFVRVRTDKEPKDCVYL